ncbi:hypothetical protein ACL02U_20715 [Streptomyces sp. MS06]
MLATVVCATGNAAFLPALALLGCSLAPVALAVRMYGRRSGDTR